MIPPDNPYYDFIKNLDRTPLNFYIGELDEDVDRDGNGNVIDPFGIDSVQNTTTYRWRKNFEYAAAHLPWPGFSNYKGQPTAHKLIDYVRVWDVPAGIPIPNFPH